MYFYISFTIESHLIETENENDGRQVKVTIEDGWISPELGHVYLFIHEQWPCLLQNCTVALSIYNDYRGFLI